MPFVGPIFLNRSAVVVWWLALTLWLLHYVAATAGWSYPAIFDWWLDPFLMPLLLLPLMRFERQWILRQSGYRFRPVELVALGVGLSLVSEGLFPLLSQRFTADWADVMAIGFGTASYGWLMQRK